MQNILRTGFDLDFEWAVDWEGYNYSPSKKSKNKRKTLISEACDAPHSGFIQRKGGELRTYKPFVDYDDGMYLIVGHEPPSVDRCIALANQFGFLTGGRGFSGLEAAEGKYDHVEPLSDWFSMINDIQPALGLEKRGGMLEHWRRVGEATIATAQIVVKSSVDPSAPPQIVFRPRNLKDAIYIQFAASVIDEDFNVKPCPSCGKLFATGISSGRRADAKFCSDKCRVSMHRSKKGKRK